MRVLAKHHRDCPLCGGSGKVSDQIADSLIIVRDRAKFNETMRRVNAKARKRRKRKKAVAT
jgi:hypothetical protein